MFYLETMKFYILILGLLFGSLSLFADEKANLQQTIDHLIATVENSKCTFIRNGSEHTPKEAAEHMRKKYDYYKKEIKTPSDFINKCASKSELSGKPYMIKLPDGKTVKCRDWMDEELKRYRSGA